MRVRSPGSGRKGGEPCAVAPVVLAMGLTLAGCAGGGLSRPDLTLPATYGTVASANPALADQSLDAWWRLYDDPQLTFLIEEALRDNPDARTALQRIAQARANRTETLDAYLPQGELGGSAEDQHTTQSVDGLGVTTGLTGTGTGTGTGTTTTGGIGGTTGTGGSTGSSGSSGAYLTPAGDLQTYAAQFPISYEVDLFGRRRAAKRAADADVWTQRFDAEATRSTLATEVANALFQARGDAVQLADARETYRIAEELARSGDLSAAHGITSTSDAARLESDAATDAATVVRYEAVARADRRSLLTLVGHAADPLDSLVIQPVATTPPDPPATTPGALLRRRPDVREAEARLQSAAGTLDLDRLGLYPDFTLNPSIQYAKTGGAYDSASTIWTIAANATLPVLDRPRLLAAVRVQRAIGEQQVIAYEKAVQDAFRDAENGLYTLQAARRGLVHLQVAVQRARFAFDAKRRGYDLGLTDLTTLLTAETTWRTALLTYNTAVVTTLTDSANLFQALGGGWTPPPLPTNHRQDVALAAAPAKQP